MLDESIISAPLSCSKKILELFRSFVGSGKSELVVQKRHNKAKKRSKIFYKYRLAGLYKEGLLEMSQETEPNDGYAEDYFGAIHKVNFQF